MTPISNAYAEILMTSGSRAIPKFPFSGSFVSGSASRSGSGESTISGLRHHYSKSKGPANASASQISYPARGFSIDAFLANHAKPIVRTQRSISYHDVVN